MRSRIIRADNEDAERANVVQASIDRGFHSSLWWRLLVVEQKKQHEEARFRN
jgi:hypothetical protein